MKITPAGLVLFVLLPVGLFNVTGCTERRAPLALPTARGVVWSEFSSPQGRFSILMPGTPHKERQKAETPLGPIEVEIFLVPFFNDSYGVSYNDYPDAITRKEFADQVLDGARNGTAKSMKGHVVSETKITLDGHPGRDYLLGTPTGGYRSRIYLIGQRLYQLAVRGPSTSSADAHKFFESFRITK